MTASVLLGWLLTYAVHSTVLLLLVWLLEGRGSLPPSWRDVLWKTALVGGVLTSSVQAAAGIHPLGGAWTFAEAPPGAAVGSGSPAAPAEAATVASRGRADAEAHLPEEGGRLREWTAWAALRSGAADSGAVALRVPGMATSAVSLWVLLACGLLLRLAVEQARTLRALGARAPVRDTDLDEALARLQRQAGGTRAIHLSMSPATATPLALGRAEIVLPERALRELSRPELEAALAHELAHLTRRDPLWNVLASCVQAVFFFQPLNLLARRRVAAAAEDVCDAWAVRASGSPIPLARCLTTVAVWVEQGSRPQAAALVSMAARPSGLVQRVERILALPRLRTREARRLRSSAAAGLLVLVGLVGPRVAPAPTAGSAPAPPIADVPALPVDAEDVAADARVLDERASFGPGAQSGETVRRHPDPTALLTTRWAWALERASERRTGEAWVAFRFPSVLRDGQAPRAGVPGGRDPEPSASLEEVFDAATDPGQAYALLRIKPARDRSATIVDAAAQPVGLGGFAFGGRTIYWLGDAAADASAALLTTLLDTADAEVREDVVALLALHDPPIDPERTQAPTRDRDADSDADQEASQDGTRASSLRSPGPG